MVPGRVLSYLCGVEQSLNYHKLCWDLVVHDYFCTILASGNAEQYVFAHIGLDGTSLHIVLVRCASAFPVPDGTARGNHSGVRWFTILSV